MFRASRRVGRLDAILRFLAGVALIGGAAWLFGHVQIDWALSLLHLLILGAYLIATAVTGIDFLYNAFDVSTNPDFRPGHVGRRRARLGRAARPPT